MATLLPLWEKGWGWGVWRASGPLHYTEITECVITAGIPTYSGQTPHATMGALLYTDTLKPDARFRWSRFEWDRI